MISFVFSEVIGSTVPGVALPAGVSADVSSLVCCLSLSLAAASLAFVELTLD